MKRVFSVILIFIFSLSFIPSAAFAEDEYNIGDIWTVDGLLSLTILNVAETSDRNEYSDKQPAAVYVVDYAYKNLGYEDPFSVGLYVSIDDQIVDAAGAMGYSYPGDQVYYAQETPVGATCIAQSVIGVDNPGNFKLHVSKYDADGTRHKATFNVDLSAEPAVLDNTIPLDPFDGAFMMNEPWTVDGQWSVSITGVTETDARNTYSEKVPGAVYIVDYTYSNLGFEEEYSDGLYISIEECIVDNVGFMGYSYPGDVTYYPQETPLGATCKAQACIGVPHAGNFQLVISKYDGNGDVHSANFYVPVD